MKTNIYKKKHQKVILLALIAGALLLIIICFFATKLIDNNISEQAISKEIIYQEVSSDSIEATKNISNLPKMFNKQNFDQLIPKIYNGEVQHADSIAKSLENKVKIEYQINNRNIYTAQKDNCYEKIIAYLHGGAFVTNIVSSQIQLAYDYSNELNAKVYIPDYPLVPNATFKDAIGFLDDFCIDLLDKNPNKEIVFMGDSSGGNLYARC